MDFGDGDDIGTLQWSEDGGTARTNLNLAVYGAAGSDAFGARIGRTGFNTTTNVQADMGAGGDGFVVQALNPTSSFTMAAAQHATPTFINRLPNTNTLRIEPRKIRGSRVRETWATSLTLQIVSPLFGQALRISTRPLYTSWERWSTSRPISLIPVS